MAGAMLLLACLPLLRGDNPDQYEYVKDTDRYVGLVYKGGVSVGRLDGNGNFLPEPSMINLTGFKSGLPQYTLLVRGLQRGRPLYEYRSGRLIRGVLDKDGNFIPELGSTVIGFEDYLKAYQPDKSLKIYNLPGKIIKKGGKAKQQK